MSNVVIWHNPRCSKSRETLKLLKDNGVEPTIVEYLKDVPTKKELQEALKMLGLEARQMMRTKEKLYKENALADVSAKAELIAAMHENPVLIERPIVFHKNKAAIGRPPENVLEIL